MDKASAASAACCSCYSPAQRANIERKGEGGGAADGCAAASRDIVLGLAPGSGPMDKAAKDYFPCAGAVGCVEREGRSTDVLAAAAVADADGSRSGAAGDGVERAGGCEGGAPRPACSDLFHPDSPTKLFCELISKVGWGDDVNAIMTSEVAINCLPRHAKATMSEQRAAAAAAGAAEAEERAAARAHAPLVAASTTMAGELWCEGLLGAHNAAGG